MLSQGPMISHGGRDRCTQRGNNNGYCLGQRPHLDRLGRRRVRRHPGFTRKGHHAAGRHPVFRRQRFSRGKPIRDGDPENLISPQNARNAVEMTPATGTRASSRWRCFLNGEADSEPDKRRERIVDDSLPDVFQRARLPSGVHHPDGQYA